MNDNKPALILSIIAVIVALGTLEQTIKSTNKSIVIIDSCQKTIDSLEMEIQLRDNLINQCKDTTYGEEKTN